MGFGVLYSIIQEHYFFLKIFGSAYIIHLSYKFYKAGIYNEITKRIIASVELIKINQE